MAQDPQPKRIARTSREEKLSVLSALLGPEALAKLDKGLVSDATAKTTLPEVADTQRAEWHRNRLLERFRVQSRSGNFGNAASPEILGRQPGKTSAGTTANATSVDQKLARLSSLADLGGEHPAVIARVLSQMPRVDRVTALKTLPGPTARSVVRRLR